MSGAARIHEYLRAHVDAGDFPGASFLVAEEDRVLAEGALGLAVARPERIPAATSTLYDLASLTKPLAGALLAARLSVTGRLSFEDRLARHLPEWPTEGEASRITLLDLLTHRSGLPAWRPVYVHAAGRESYLQYFKSLALDRPPGSRVAYSDPGYILLGFALERAGGAPLDRLFETLITNPLQIIEDLLYRPAPDLRRRIAATEEGNRKERLLAGPEGDGYNGWSAEVAWGDVHDLNARALGGISAHAGLFGTARAVHRLALEVLGPGSGLLEESQRRLMRTNLTAGLGEDRSLGYLLASSPGSAAGGALSRRSFGHTGFTGTSLWIDPDARRIYVLLTNRVHPEFREIDMNAIRRGFHHLAAAR
jgi:serine-type D-Ala-D-Ala carboxypeptidase